jgi:Flp pilus assembly protein TadG
MINCLRLFARDSRASVGAEMALVLPMLIILLFGGLEGGYYLWSEHKVLKAVRDGARYASRQPFEFDDGGAPAATFDCGTLAVADSVIETNIMNVTRTGTIDGSGQPKIPSWTTNAGLTVTVAACDATTATGLYKEFPDGAPIVRVSADVTYPSLFFNLGFATSGLHLRASSQAAVMGI